MNIFTISKKLLLVIIIMTASCHAQQENLISAAEAKNFDWVKELVESGAYINETNENNNSPLHFAVMDNNYEMARYLVGRGADVNTFDIDGYTPLYLALLNENSDMVKLLVGAGAEYKKWINDYNLLQEVVSIFLYLRKPHYYSNTPAKYIHWKKIES